MCEGDSNREVLYPLFSEIVYFKCFESISLKRKTLNSKSYELEDFNMAWCQITSLIMVQVKLNGRFCVNECLSVIEAISLDLPMQHFHIGSLSQSLMFAIYQEIYHYTAAAMQFSRSTDFVSRVRLPSQPKELASQGPGC